MNLLQHLWEQASLNRWGRGWQRDYWRVRRELLAAAEHVRLPDRGPVLGRRLYIPPEYRPPLREEIERGWADFRTRVLAPPPGEDRPGEQDIASDDAPPSGFVLGEVRDLLPARYAEAHRLDLRHHRDALIIDSALYQSVVRHNLQAITRAAQHGHAQGHVMALAEVQATRGHSLKVVALHMMVCSRHYLPVVSQHEAELADALVAADRGFVKPAHEAGSDTPAPDFVLLDTHPPTAVAVLGMETQQYLKRKDDMLRRHAHQGLATWVWEAAAGRRMPGLPPVAG